MEETNNWARLAFQLYFGWFALQFTINAIGMSWLFTYTGPKPWFANLVYSVLIGWNLTGTIGTVLVYRGLVACDVRINQVFQTIAGPYQYGQTSWSRPRSPVPRPALSLVFIFCAVTMLMSLSFWIVLFLASRT